MAKAAIVAIIDYGVGNLRSVEKAFTAMGCDAVVTSDASLLRKADRLVLPGVGAFAACMRELSARGFDEVVRERANDGTPLLGVCVGMQMLFEESEEFGKTPGLGLLRGCVRRFPDDLVVPQVGWNQVRQRGSHPLLAGIADNTFFYFGIHEGESQHTSRASILHDRWNEALVVKLHVLNGNLHLTTTPRVRK